MKLWKSKLSFQPNKHCTTLTIIPFPSFTYHSPRISPSFPLLPKVFSTWSSLALEIATRHCLWNYSRPVSPSVARLCPQDPENGGPLEKGDSMRCYIGKTGISRALGFRVHVNLPGWSWWTNCLQALMQPSHFRKKMLNAIFFLLTTGIPKGSPQLLIMRLCHDSEWIPIPDAPYVSICLPAFCHKSLHSRANAGKYVLHPASGIDWPNFGSRTRPILTYVGEGETSIIYKPTDFGCSSRLFFGEGPQQSRF